MREYDAISDIKLQNCDNVKMSFNDICIGSKKIENKWDIEYWFTIDKPLLVVCMYYTMDYLIFNAVNDKTVVTWNQIRYNENKRNKLIKKSQSIRYYNFDALYLTGQLIVCPHDYNAYKLNCKPNLHVDFS